ncbi:MAG TPA: DUF2721 domain-containing protein [Vicinamibacterales bacterium]|nr:DUF2721 domain-containing protein [Vicinamibacterales bacterium]
MSGAHLAELVPVLQVAIAPAILISGVGLLLLTMTNRFGRIIDRSRILAAAIRGDNADERARAESQVMILWRRARLARQAIVLGGVSVLLAAALVIVLFVAALAHLEIAAAIVALFAACLLTLIASLVVFLREIDISLEALKYDLFGRKP